MRTPIDIARLVVPLVFLGGEDPMYTIVGTDLAIHTNSLPDIQAPYVTLGDALLREVKDMEGLQIILHRLYNITIPNILSYTPVSIAGLVSMGLTPRTVPHEDGDDDGVGRKEVLWDWPRYPARTWPFVIVTSEDDQPNNTTSITASIEGWSMKKHPTTIFSEMDGLVEFVSAVLGREVKWDTPLYHLLTTIMGQGFSLFAIDRNTATFWKNRKKMSSTVYVCVSRNEACISSVKQTGRGHLSPDTSIGLGQGVIWE